MRRNRTILDVLREVQGETADGESTRTLDQSARSGRLRGRKDAGGAGEGAIPPVPRSRVPGLSELLARPWFWPGAAFGLFLLLWGGWALFGGRPAEAAPGGGAGRLSVGVRGLGEGPRRMHVPEAPDPDLALASNALNRSRSEKGGTAKPASEAEREAGAKFRSFRALRIDSYRNPSKTQRGYAKGMQAFLRSRGFDARMGRRGKELIVYVVVPEGLGGAGLADFVASLRRLGTVRRREFTKDFSTVSGEIFEGRTR